MADHKFHIDDDEPVTDQWLEQNDDLAWRYLRNTRVKCDPDACHFANRLRRSIAEIRRLRGQLTARDEPSLQAVFDAVVRYRASEHVAHHGTVAADNLFDFNVLGCFHRSTAEGKAALRDYANKHNLNTAVIDQVEWKE